MQVETQIHLNKFKPRHYQLPVMKAFDSGKYKKFLIINPRRSGKDFEWWWLMIREACTSSGLFLYCLPTFSQARSVIWEGKTNEGLSFLDVIPKECITKIRHDSMTIYFTSGAILRLVGSDSYNTSIIGSNPRFIVFSEYGLCDENAYKLAALPILRGNQGVVGVIGTPRGKNHFFELYQIAKNSPDWFSQLLTIEDTGHISEEEVKKEIASGEISESLALQEYYCSFSHGDEHSYYAKQMNTMKLKGRIGIVDWEPYHKVYTAWDLGLKDLTVIIMFQVIGESVRIFDYYENSDKLISHYAQIIANKRLDGYLFAKHFGPHDLHQRDKARGLTTREMYNELGVNFSPPIYIEIEDGIEVVRRTLSRVWIDEKKCAKLIKALENYSEKYDSKNRVYLGVPKHDIFSHAADAMRYLCAALPNTKEGLSPEKLDKMYAEAMGYDTNIPAVFRDDLPRY
jgi:phage terminase large subunit